MYNYRKFFSFSNFINNVHSSLRFSGINLFIVRSVAISNLLQSRITCQFTSRSKNDESRS